MEVGTNVKAEGRLVGRVLADKYRIESVIREDGVGTVYLGRHLLMEKPVTVKTLAAALSVDPQIVDRFSLEAKTISRLSHPNILNVTDFGRDVDGTIFTVLEHVEGETLEQLIAKEGALPVERATRIARQIAGALSAVHSDGIIHTALSSKNVLVSEAGDGRDLVKIFDIGTFLSGFRASPDSEQEIDVVAYLSPEQCSQSSEADERSDIYSLGIIFYELLTGELPFTADTPTDLMLKHVETPPPPLSAFRSDLPEDIEPILLNALAKNPDRRFQTAAAFAEDLGEAIVEDATDETVVVPQTKDAGASNNNLWKTAFIVLAGISLMSFGLIFWTGNRPSEPVTSLPTDENSQPVQPLNPATGVYEQGNLMSLPPGTLIQPDPALTNPDVGGGGDGYDPWGNVPVPPSGRGRNEPPIGPPGDVYTIPGDGSIFMPDPDGGGVILVPKVIPEDSPSPKPTKSPVPTKSPEKISVPTPEKQVQPSAKPTPAVKQNDGSDSKPAAAKPAKPDPTPSAERKSPNTGLESDS